MLTIDRLGRREGRLQILEDVSFTWPKGLLAVIGGNGSGKTTLLRVVAGAKSPNTGKADWNGFPPPAPPGNAARSATARRSVTSTSPSPCANSSPSAATCAASTPAA